MITEKSVLVPVTEVEESLSSLLKKVDEQGSVVLTVKGAPAYVLVKYNNLEHSGYLGEEPATEIGREIVARRKKLAENNDGQS